jgi:hypothetical protein
MLEEAQNEQEETEDSKTLLTISDPEPENSEAENFEEIPHLAADPADQAIEESKPVAERPKHIEEKHWDTEKGEIKAEDLAKSYRELRTHMDAGKHKPPKDGKYSIEGFENLAEDDEIVNDYRAAAEDIGLSQAQFEKTVQFLMDKVGVIEEEAISSFEEEQAKLGPNSEKIIASTDAWLNKFAKAGVLNQAELKSIATASSSATFVNAINKIRRSYGEKDIPPVDVGIDAASTSMSDINVLMGDPRYGVDMAFTRDVERKVYELHGEKL